MYMYIIIICVLYMYLVLHVFHLNFKCWYYSIWRKSLLKLVHRFCILEYLGIYCLWL